MKKNGALQEFCRVAKIPQPAKCFSYCHCSPACHCSPLLLFHAFSFLLQFFFLPILSIVIAFDFGSFCIFAWLGQYISSCTVIKDNFCSVIKLAGSFQLSHFFSFSPIFSHFLSTFSLAKHPPRMKTRRMSGYNLLLLEVEGHWAQDLEQSKEFPIFHAGTHCHLCSPFTLGLDPFDSC